MKSVGVMLVFCGMFTACVTEKEIQVERVHVQLIKVDTLYRESGNLKALTWKTENNMKFYSIEPIEAEVPIGTTMGLMMRR